MSEDRNSDLEEKEIRAEEKIIHGVKVYVINIEPLIEKYRMAWAKYPITIKEIKTNIKEG